MKISEIFAGLLRGALVAFIGLIICITVLISNDSRVHAQNAGTVGIYTKQISVFTAQTVKVSSPIFPDFGFAANFLTYCTTGFTGTIDLEWNPTGAIPYTAVVLVQATYPTATPDTACHTMQVGGYFPNMRSTVIPTVDGSSGSVSAWYTASAGPIPLFSAGIGSNGPSSPILCDRNTTSSQTSGGTSTIGFIAPIASGDAVVICGFTVSFNGATSAGTVSIEWASSTTACTSLAGSPTWQIQTTSSTPQLLTTSLLQRTNSANAYPCLQNSSGATALIAVSYASVHGL
jgi:hypothetical protein